MKNDVQILFEILADPDQEVIGHAAPRVSAELQEQIAKFAAGTCSEKERDEVKKMLLQRPELIPLLARETRGLRQSEE